MIKLAEQSNVPFVFTRTTVGTPALAITTRGEYPPLADMSMICVPSTIVAVGVAASPRFEAYPGETSRNAPPIKAVLTTIETAVVVFIVLEIEEWADDSGSGERVRAVYESQRDNNDTSRLKEDALPWLVCNIQRTEGEKGAAVTFASEAIKRGAVVIDNGADFRLKKDVPTQPNVELLSKGVNS